MPQRKRPEVAATTSRPHTENAQRLFGNIFHNNPQPRIVGIDVGLSGAIARLSGEALDIQDMPTHTIKRGKTARRDIDVYELARIFDAMAPIDHVYIEAVHSLPGQGVASTFAFGKAFGTIIGIVAASFVPMTLVTPNEWKRQLRVPADKDGSRKRASELLPQYSALWNRAKDHNRAEAALIALYGARVAL